MNEKNAKRFSPLGIAGRIVVLICFIFMIAGIIRFGVKNILIDRGHAESEFYQKIIALIYRDNPGAELVREKPVSIDWEKLYSFETDEKEASAQEKGKNQTKKKAGILSRKLDGLESKITSIENKINYYFEDALLGRKDILETGAVLAHFLQWDIPEKVKNSSYIFWGGKTGHISQCKAKVDVTEASESLIDLARWVEEQGISFVYVQYPAKMSGIKAEQLPKGFYSYIDENVDGLLKRLEAENIPFLDIRADMMPEGADNMFELFFRTDHHWLPQTGLRAAGFVAEYLKQDGLDIDLELFEPKNYSVENYEGIFLGSYGRTVTAGLIDSDDFPVVTPNFDTSLKITIPNLNLEREGAFDETLLNMDMLYLQPSYEQSQYDVYCWSDRPLIKIENEQTQNRNRILILKDSFGNTVNPYLALTLGETTLIDLRQFTGSLRTYIEQYRPDYVIVSYSSSGIEENVFDASHTSIWDFR